MEFLRLLEEFRTPMLDVCFQGITWLGQSTFLGLMALFLYFAVSKKIAYETLTAFFLSGILLQAVKLLFRVPRPWVLDPDFTPVAWAVSAATGYSFPSGHTQGAAVFFGTLFLYAPGKIKKAGCAAVILAVGFSRMYLGCHTPKDVAVGMALGILAVAAVRRAGLDFTGKVSQKEKNTMIFLGILSGAVLFLSLLMAGISYVPWEEAADCIKVSVLGMGFLGLWLAERREK